VRRLTALLLFCAAVLHAGSLIFTKYFGGSGTDTATAVATDNLGNIYIAGTSNSVDFPTTTAVQPKVRAPMLAISATAATPIPVGTETSVLAVAGTSDGSVIYAFCADATYASSDGGATWGKHAPLPSDAINGISIDAADPARVFVATNRGVYSTDSGGEYWGLNQTGLPLSGSGFVAATWVAVSPVNPLAIYVLTGSEGLYMTANASVYWTPINVSYPNQPTGAPFQPWVAALTPDGSGLYVIDGYGNLVESTDGGVTWHELAQQLYSAASLLIDLANPSNLYVSDYSGIQKSSDGGMTFTTLSPHAAGAPVAQQIALVSSSQMLYFSNSSSLLNALPSGGGAPASVAASTPNLHWLAALGDSVYAGFDAPYTAYVTKWDPTGTNLLYSTFFGGSLQDTISGLAVDAQGECTVSGSSDSPDFPVTTNFNSSGAVAPQSGFVTRLSPDGTRLIYSDLIGQSASVSGLALDSTGAAYVTGQTQTTTAFPLTSNAFQSARPQATCSRPSDAPFLVPDSLSNAFVSKISADGSQLLYSTLVTGSCGSTGTSVAVDTAGEAVVAGYTMLADFPATAGSYQAAFPGDSSQIVPPNAFLAGFAAKLSAAGDRLIAATYLGGSFETEANGVALDSAGNVYLSGTTAKILPGATPGAYQPMVTDRCAYPVSIGPSPPYGGTNDAFVLKLDPMLSTPAYLTYLGGGCDDGGSSIALDGAGNAWIIGLTQSPDFPLRTPFAGGGLSTRFVSEISTDGSELLFSSATNAVAVAIDPDGQVSLAGSALTQGETTHDKTTTSAEWTKVDSNATTPMVVNGAAPVTAYPPSILEPSFLGTPIVPGELIQITGSNLGPATQVNGQLDSTGHLPFSLAGTTVLFDSIPAPIVSVASNSITCFAPFEITQTTNITAESNGQRSNTVKWGVKAADLQILSVVNPDGTLNSATNPARPGDVILFYVSGLGETLPLSADGLVNSAPLAVPVASVMVNVAGHVVQPLYIGAAPGQVAGIVQLNVQVPAAGYASNPVNVGLNSDNAPLYLTQ
jgi:uncharacterized protein (TIGR03437 family)